jgi:glycosyltransferase involved in cell wall biosynthesis
VADDSGIAKDHMMQHQSPNSLIKGTSQPRRAWVLSSWLHGTGFSDRLGASGYSYDYLARLYLPLLERLGEVHWIRSRKELEPTIQHLRARGLDPVHVSFAPFQNAVFSSSAPNVLVLAWEFPDIPDHEFDGNPQNNWVAAADRCAMVMVASPYTERALVDGGVQTPVKVVPAPVSDAYFRMAPWTPGRSAFLDCLAYVFQSHETASASSGSVSGADDPKTLRRRIKSYAHSTGRTLAKAALPPRCYQAARAVIHVARNGPFGACGGFTPAWMPDPVRGVELSGVVYTSILNPDGRKNWEDLITGFTLALRDCPDATLVIKLATKAQDAIHQVVGRCKFIGIPHRCKVVVIAEYLSDEQMQQLTEASAYYVTTTRAEGICLPLMDYLAAGRPGISPCHTALADYFGRENGFVIESHPEPMCFPHDRRLRLLTSWQRIVWTSLADQLRASYLIAKQKPNEYEAFSRQGRDILRRWASVEVVQPRLESAMAALPVAKTHEARAA